MSSSFMDLKLFLDTQDWLLPTALSRADGLESAPQKRSRPSTFSCNASFHISMAEQYRPASQWCGPKAADAVFIRLSLPGGLVSSTAKVDVAVVGQGAEQKPMLTWCDTAHAIKPGAVSKVICSANVFATLPAEIQQYEDGNSLVVATHNTDCPDLDFISLLCSHVCLNLFAEHSAELQADLAR
eukprot:GHRR01022756.1.p1 GENE.GHRR01022756.1~~GHRR01022756.1.p1  ORF type:complete len:184 (+),score=27.50 GHRR01022756.1:355-906(+)